jgi:hypothetical protein
VSLYTDMRFGVSRSGGYFSPHYKGPYVRDCVGGTMPIFGELFGGRSFSFDT